MCFGQGCGADTLHPGEQIFLREIAEKEFHAYDFAVRSNDEGQSWVVLAPRSIRLDLQRFTICRIDPCVMVMSEDHEARRQFCSATCVEDAVGYIRLVNDQLQKTLMDARPLSAVLQ